VSLITLTTDFGLGCWFVATMKGVIKNINPHAEILDITHNVKPYNVPEAAFVLQNCYAYFPSGTIHTVVVDPGVGSDRHAVIAKSSRYSFVAPDNGVLSYALDREEIETVIKIECEKFLLLSSSNTFHGRDVFAPAAAYLSLGVAPEEFGPVLEQWQRLKPSLPRKLADREVVGHILCVDPFGNLITDVTQSFLHDLCSPSQTSRLRILIRDREIQGLRRTYSEGKQTELVALFGSSGHLEISINRGSAADTLGLKEGGKFILRVP
jgi:S-adenosylmethionine hydrolase